MQDQEKLSIAEKRKVMFEITIKEADLKKLKNREDEIISAIRQFEKRMASLKVEIGQRQEEMKKIESDKRLLENEIKKLNSKLN